MACRMVALSALAVSVSAVVVPAGETTLSSAIVILLAVHVVLKTSLCFTKFVRIASTKYPCKVASAIALPTASVTTWLATVLPFVVVKY